MGIGNRLRELRISKKLTQEDVGKLLGVSKATVNRYETEQIDIKRTTALRLGKILNVSPSYIMGWTDITDTSADAEILDLYHKLDTEDKAEIRGEIKHMLKSNKYKKADLTFSTPPRKIAAFGANGTKSELKPNPRKIT